MEQKLYTRICPRCKNSHKTTSKDSGAICEDCKHPRIKTRDIYYEKKSSKKTKTKTNSETGEKEYEIYDCRLKVDDINKIILWIDCSCWNFQNKRIRKVGRVQDTKYPAEPCKHLASVVSALRGVDYKFKDVSINYGLDSLTPALRKQILEAYKHECAFNGCHEKKGLEIHRRIPGVNGGKYSLLNCEPLCKYHHEMVTFQRYRDLK